jgi:hypothetical protein
MRDSPDERSGQAMWPKKTKYKHMKSFALNISLDDLFKSLSKLSRQEKREIHSFLESKLSKDEVNDPIETYRLSEKTLPKDWVSEKENTGWKEL